MPRKNIVVVGGGTGNHTTLSGLKSLDCNITAVVAMTDSGGSSGRLRDELGHLPPGDLRRCLMALAGDAETSKLMRRLFDYRFSTGDGLNGHNFGNLILSALTEVTGDTITAIQQAGRILGITGAVLPVTLGKATLCARLMDGSELVGESTIDSRRDNLDVPIDYIYLDPKPMPIRRRWRRSPMPTWLSWGPETSTPACCRICWWRTWRRQSTTPGL